MDITHAQATIADRAAVADIETEGVAQTDAQGRKWYDTRPMLDPREAPPQCIDMARITIDYALQRGLVQAHPQHAYLLRITGGRAL